MSYVTESRLASLIDLPISLPETDLEPNQWIVITTLGISIPQAFTLTVLQLSLSSVVNNDTGVDSLTLGISQSGLYPFPGIPALVTPGFGLAYAGLYLGFDTLTPPVNQAAQEAPLILNDPNQVLPILQARTLVPATYAAAGNYSVVVANNTSNCVLRLTALGQLRLDLGLS